MARAPATFPTLVTKRLRLRQFETGDLVGLHTCFSDQQAMRFWNFPACRTMAETANMLAWLASTTRRHDHLAWAIAKKSSGQLIGMVNYHHRDARHRRLHLGYIIAPGQQGNGFGTEAVRAVLSYCSEALKAHRIGASIHPDNAASIRLVEGLGFCCEGGPLTDYWRVGGKSVSPMIYALVKRQRPAKSSRVVARRPPA
jgi:[ribosomal protein S5]-alanine N-acetyltransferase